MTDYFVITGGSDVAAGTSFDVGFATIRKGMDVIAAGTSADRLFVDYLVKDNDTVLDNVSWTASGTRLFPSLVQSVDSTTSATSGTNGSLFDYTPMDQTIDAGAVFDHGYTKNNSTRSFHLLGFWHIRGVNFGADGGIVYICETDGGTMVFDDLCLSSDYDSSAAFRSTGVGSSAIFNNVTLALRQPSSGWQFTGGGHIIMNGGGLHSSTDATAAKVFYNLSSYGGKFEFYDFDFSPLADNASILGTNTTNGYIDFQANGCVFPSGASFDDWTINSAASQVRVYACGFGAASEDLGQLLEYGINGTTTDELTTVGSATYDGSNNYSVVMSPTSTTKEATNPLRHRLSITTLAALATVKVQVTSDTALDDTMFWIEAWKPDGTQAGFSEMLTTRGSIEAPVTLTTAALSPWTSPKTNEYEVELTLSDNTAGTCTIYACAAHAAGTAVIYVDPEPAVT